jgi:hypothetical protein
MPQEKSNRVLKIPLDWVNDRIRECSSRILAYGSADYYVAQIMILNEILKEFDKDGRAEQQYEESDTD